MNMKLLLIGVYIFTVLNVSALPVTDEPVLQYDGDNVYINTQQAYISAPGTIYGSGWTYLNVSTKVYTGYIDLAVGFDTDHIQPTKAELYNPHIVEWNIKHEHNFYNVDVYMNYSGEPLDYGYEYNTYKRVIIHDVYNLESNTTDKIISYVAFDSYYNFGDNNYTIYWDSIHSKIDDWRDISNKFNILPEKIHNNYNNKNKWYYVRDQYVVAGTEYQIRIKVDAPPQLGQNLYKYDVVIKPATQTFYEAKILGNLYVLDPYWNTSYSNRKLITVTTDGTSTPVNYQVLLNISHESDMQADFDDVRFTNSSNGELSYWIENKVDSTYAKIWVNLTDAITAPASDTIWMYYGNSGSSDGSNGVGTFIQYHGSASSDFLDSLSVVPTNIIYEGKIRSTADTHDLVFGLSNSANMVDDSLHIESWSGGLRYIGAENEDTRTAKSEAPGFTTNQWYRGIITCDGTNVYGYVDDNQVGTGSITTNIPDENLGLWMFAYGGSGTLEQEWSFVRKYLANEPIPSYGSIQYFVDSLHYNSTTNYNNSVESDGTITTNRSSVTVDDTNWTAHSTGITYWTFTSQPLQIGQTTFVIEGDVLNNFTTYNLTPDTPYKLVNSSGDIEKQTTDVNGSCTFTVNLTSGTYWVELSGVIITLLSQEPSIIYANTTGYFNQTWGIKHVEPINKSTLTYIYHNVFDSDYNHSLRLPSNNLTVDGWRGSNRNKTCQGVSLVLDDNISVFEGDYNKWSGIGANNTRMTINEINSTYTIVYIDGVSTVQSIAFTQSWYLDRRDVLNATKTTIDINKHRAWIIKFYNADVYAGRDNNYTLSIWIDTTETNIAPPSPGETCSLWWANGSFDPMGGVNIKNSPFSDPIGSINYTQWLDHEYVLNKSRYIKVDVYGNTSPEIIKDPEMYLYFEFDSPKNIKINVSNVETCTNRSFAQTDTMWYGAIIGNTYTSYPFTPDIWTSYHRGNQTFESQLWVIDQNNSLFSSIVEQTEIQKSLYPPMKSSYHGFGFKGYIDTSMDCTYRDNITILINIGGDPDGGVTHGNLTLHYANNLTLVDIINSSILGGAGIIPVEFNTTPYYNEDILYTMKCEVTDDENTSSSQWLSLNFALSSLGSIGTIWDTNPSNNRVLFWGVNDIHSLYLAINNNSIMSLSGGNYMINESLHHGQYGDIFYINESIRLKSDNDVLTPYYRFTGSNEINNTSIVSWNITTGTPALAIDEYRSYIYSDKYYSTVNVTNSNLSYLGRGVSPNRGVYFKNGENAVIDNCTFIGNERGLMVRTGSNYTISNCTFNGSVETTMTVIDSGYGNISIRDNYITATNETSGISMRNCSTSNEIINNVVISEVDGVAQNAYYTRYTEDSTFSNNTAINTQFGVFISYGADNITVSDNNLSVRVDNNYNLGYGISTFVGSHNFTDNIIKVHDGYGIFVETTNNCTMLNNSIIIDNDLYADYRFNDGTGHIIKNPFDVRNTIYMEDNVSLVRIENNDSQAFTEDSISTSYAFTNGNYSLVLSGTTETVTITQRNMSILPIVDNISIWGIEWDSSVRFNVSSNTVENPTWYNITNSSWASRSIEILRNGTYYSVENADINGQLRYNYTGNYSEKWFEFRLNVPYIDLYSPDSPVTTVYGNAQTFTINTSQIVNISWLSNGSVISTSNNVNYSTYTNSIAEVGTYNITAYCENINGSVQQVWVWTVENDMLAILLNLQSELDGMKKTQMILQALVLLIVGVVVGAIAKRKRYNDDDGVK